MRGRAVMRLDALFFNTMPAFVCVLHLFKAFRPFYYLLVSQLKNENVIPDAAAPGKRI